MRSECIAARSTAPAVVEEECPGELGKRKEATSRKYVAKRFAQFSVQFSLPPPRDNPFFRIRFFVVSYPKETTLSQNKNKKTNPPLEGGGLME